MDKKGLYFFFLDQSCYQQLNLTAINSVYQREIEGKLYDLVYVGTAGTNRQGNSDLRERLKWHLCQTHSDSAICSGALSTFRMGLSSLLAEDLILDNTEKLFNDFVCANMYLYWLEYTDIQAINSDEKILIKTLRPLFNIRNNPNALKKSIENSTSKYRKIRLNCIEKTRKRLNCIAQNSKTNKGNSKQTDPAPSYEFQVLEKCDGLIKYTVTIDQDIYHVTNGISGFPKKGAKIEICDIEKFQKKFDWWKFRKTNNIYSYFNNDHTNGTHKGKRSLKIKEWMCKNTSNEIMVSVSWEV